MNINLITHKSFTASWATRLHPRVPHHNRGYSFLEICGWGAEILESDGGGEEATVVSMGAYPGAEEKE